MNSEKNIGLNLGFYQERQNVAQNKQDIVSKFELGNKRESMEEVQTNHNRS